MRKLSFDVEIHLRNTDIVINIGNNVITNGSMITTRLDAEKLVLDIAMEKLKDTDLANVLNTHDYIIRITNKQEVY